MLANDFNFGLYIHVPYCRRKCLYCDFYSGGSRIADYAGYVDAVLSELDERREELRHDVTSVYLGGGTPSLLPVAEMRRLVEVVRSVVGQKWRVEEFTLEINPDDVTPSAVDSWLGIGVNRFSLGVQSLDDAVLRRIGRLHDSRSALDALDILQSRCGNISVDVMFGIPGQDMESWRDTLSGLVERHPTHVSCYSLMYEPSTAMTLLRDEGRIKEAPEELSVEMYRHMREYLERHGYEAYEISNFALPGYRSRHNSSYWAGCPYVGLGPSAHSYDGERRRSANPADLKLYLDIYGRKGTEGRPSGRKWERVVETLSDEERLDEYILTRMRTAEGIDIEDFGSKFHPETKARLLKNARKGLGEGMLEINDEHLRLTPDGIMVSDDLIADLAML